MMRFWELALILIIVLIFFGPGKLPDFMKDMGKGMKAFKDGLKDEDDVKPPTVVQKDDVPPPSV